MSTLIEKPPDFLTKSSAPNFNPSNSSISSSLDVKNITGKDAEYALGLADITVNKNMVPFDDQSPFITSGIRVGTPAITTRGLKEKEIEKIVEFIDKAIFNFQNDKKMNGLCDDINNMMSQYPIFAY